MAVTEDARSSYACGERPTGRKSKIQVSLQRYLVYFVVFDSSALLLAFAAFGLSATNVILFTLYASLVFVSCLLLFGGD